MAQIVVPSRGELSQTSLADLLLSLYEQRQSCVLVVQRGSVRKELSLRDGELVRIISSEPSESLSRFLGLGAASQEVLFRHLQDNPNTFLEAIVARGLASRDEIERRLGEAARVRLRECISWERGSFELLPIEPLAAGRTPRPVLPLVHGIFEGLASTNKDNAGFALPQALLRSPLRKTSRAGGLSSVFLSVFGEDCMLASLQDDQSGHEYAEKTGDAARVSTTLYALLKAGLVEAVGVESRAVSTEETVLFEVGRFPGEARTRRSLSLSVFLDAASQSAADPLAAEKRAALISLCAEASMETALQGFALVHAWGMHSDAVEDLASLAVAVGRACEEDCSRLDLAAEHYRYAIRLVPSHSAAQEALFSILAAIGDDDSCVNLLSSSIQAETAPNRRASLYRMLATLLADHLGDLVSAERALRSALALRPFWLEALEDMIVLLERTVETEGQPRRSAAYVERSVENRLLPKRAAIYLERIARHSLAESGDVDLALSYLRRALEIDPDSRDIWSLVERVLRSAGRWGELEDLYRAGMIRTDTDGKEAMLRKLAGLEVFGRKGVARWACEEILKLDPSNTFARQRLRDLYEEANDHIARALLREEDIQRALTVRGRNAARLELAELCLQHFGDVDRASALIGDVLAEDPHHAAAFDMAYLYLATPENASAYAEVLQRAIESSAWSDSAEAHSPERVARAAALAWVLETQVLDLTRALSAWNRVLALAPGHIEAQSGVGRLERALAESTATLDALTHRLRATKKASERLDLLRQISQKAQGHDLDRAVQAYEELNELRPSDESTLLALEKIYTARRDFGGLVTTLRRKVGLASSDAVRAGLLNRIAILSYERLGAPEQALRTFREVLRVDPNNSTALGRMERLYRQLGNYEGLLGIYAHRAQVVTPGLERAELYRQMAKLVAEDTGRAASFWEQVLKDNPGDSEALLALEELYETENRTGDLARVLADRVARTSEGDPALPLLLRRLARLYEGGAGDPVRALSTWERLLSLVPEDAEALAVVVAARESAGDTNAWLSLGRQLFRRLREPLRASALTSRLAISLSNDLRQPEEAEKLLVAHISRFGLRGGDHARFLAKLREQRNERRAAIAALELELLAEDAPPRRVGTAQRIALLWRDGLADNIRAVEAFKRLCTLDPRNEAGWLSLSSLYESLGRYEDVLVAKENLLAIASDLASKQRLLSEMAQINERQRSDNDAALSCLLRACQLAPENTETLRALQTASARFARFGFLADYLDTLGISVRERVRRLGEVARQCATTEQSIACWQTTYERYAEEPEAFAGLTAVVESSGRYEALVEAYEARLGEVDSLERSRLLQKIGEICEKKLGDPDRAVASYKRGFESAPNDPQAVAGYAKALEERNRWEEYIKLYERVAMEALDPSVRGYALERVATVTRQKLGDLSRTFAVKRQAFDLERADRQQLQELEQLAAESGDWSSLANVYEELLFRARGDEQRLVYVERLAILQEEKLMSPRAAFARRLEAWKLSQQDQARKAEALRLATEIGAIGAIVEVLLQQAADADTTTRCALLCEAAALEERSDTERAFALYLEAYQLDTSREDILRELRRLANDDTSLATIALPDGEMMGPRRWGALLGMYERMLAAAESTEARLSCFWAIAEIFENALRTSERAFEVYEFALHLDLSNEKTLSELERLGRHGDLFGRLVKRFEEEVAKAQEARDAIPFLERLARLLDEVSREPAKAADILRRILVLQPNHHSAASQLRDILRRLGRVDELIGMLEAEIAGTPASPTRRARLREIAALYEDVLKRPREAQELYARVLAEDPSDRDALLQQLRLHEMFEEWRKLVEVESKLAQLESGPEAAVRYRHMAELYEQQLRAPRRSVDAYRDALRVDPNDVTSLRELTRLLEQQKRWEELSEVLARRASQESAEVAVSMLVRRASVLAERLGKAAAAGEVLREVLARDPQNGEARLGLVEALRIEKKYRDIEVLISSWEKEGAIHARLLAHLGEAYVALQAEDNARESFSRALQKDARCVEALHGLSEISARAGEFAKAADFLLEEAKIQGEAAGLYEEAASLYGRAEKPDSQREALRIALQQDPQRIVAARSLQQVAQSTEDFEVLRGALQQQLSRAENKERAALFAALGDVEWRGFARLEAAQDAYEAALVISPLLSRALAGLCEVQQARWTDDAVVRRMANALGQAIDQGLSRRDAYAGRLYYFFAKAKSKLGAADEALSQLRRAKERLGNNMDVLLGLAELAEQSGRTDEALQSYQQLMKSDGASERKDYAALQLHLGLLLRSKGELAAALVSLEAASESLEQQEHALPLASDLAERLEDHKRSVTLFAKQLDCTSAPAARRELQARRAEALLKLGQTEEAVTALQQAVAEPVGVPSLSLYARLLEIFAQHARWNDALPVAEEVKALLQQGSSSDDATLLNLRAAEVFSELGQSDRASHHIEAALAADPNSQTAFEALLRFHRSRNDQASLAKAYRRRLDSLSTDESTRGSLLAALAESLVAQKKYGDALVEVRAALALQPENTSLLSLCNECLAATKASADERIPVLARMVQQRPTETSLLSQLGALYQEHGEETRHYWLQEALATLGKGNTTPCRVRRLPGGQGFVPESLLPENVRAFLGIFADLWASGAIEEEAAEGERLSTSSPAGRLFQDLTRLVPTLGLQALRGVGSEVHALRSHAPTIVVGDGVPTEKLAILMAKAVAAARPMLLLVATGAVNEEHYDALRWLLEGREASSEAKEAASKLVLSPRAKLQMRTRLASLRDQQQIPTWETISAAVALVLQQTAFLYTGQLSPLFEASQGTPQQEALLRFVLSEEHVALRQTLRLFASR